MSRLPETEAVEIYAVSTVYTDGVSSIDIMPSGNARVTFFEEQRAEGKMQRVIIARFAIPQAALMDTALRIMAATGDERAAQPGWAIGEIAGRA